MYPLEVKSARALHSSIGVKSSNFHLVKLKSGTNSVIKCLDIFYNNWCHENLKFMKKKLYEMFNKEKYKVF